MPVLYTDEIEGVVNMLAHAVSNGNFHCKKQAVDMLDSLLALCEQDLPAAEQARHAEQIMNTGPDLCAYLGHRSVDRFLPPEPLRRLDGAISLY